LRENGNAKIYDRTDNPNAVHAIIAWHEGKTVMDNGISQ
jgi:hypothetical protein